MSVIGIKRLINLSALLTTSRLGGAAAGFASQIFLARWLGAEALGIFVLSISLGGVLSILCALGFPQVSPRFLGQYKVAERPDHALGYILSSRQHIYLMAAATVGLAAAGISTTSLVSETMRLPLILGCLSAPFLSFLRLNGSIALAWRRYVLSYLPDMLLKSALLLLAIVVIASLAIKGSVVQVLVAHLMIVAVLAMWQGWMLAPARNIAAGDAGRPVRPAYLHREWRAAALPMMLVVLFTAFFAELDILLLGMLLPPGDIAVFSVCLRITLLVAFGITVVNGLIIPDLSEAYARKDHATVIKTMMRANRLNVAATLIAAAGTIWFGDVALRFFGPEFESNHSILSTVMLAQIILAGAGPNIALLNLAGLQQRMVPVFLCALAGLVVLNIWFASLWGVGGAALAFVAVTLLWSGVLAVMVKIHLGYDSTILGEVHTGRSWLDSRANIK